MIAASIAFAFFLWRRESAIARRTNALKAFVEDAPDAGDILGQDDEFDGLARAIAKYHDQSQNLLQAEQEYVSLFEAFGFGTYRRSTDGRLLQVNETLAKIYGYQSAEE